MTDTSGFYKLTDTEVLFAVNTVSSPEVALTRDTKDSFTYPQDGWYWFDSGVAAYTFLTPVVSPRTIRDWEFRSRFTEIERNAINNLAFAQLDTVGQELIMAVYTASDGVPLDSLEVINGLDYWVYKGIITPERKLEILS